MSAMNSSPARLSIAVVGLSLIAAACGPRGFDTLRSQAAGPVVLSCQPAERAIVRPVEMNGTMVSQMECVPATAAQADTGAAPYAAPYDAYAAAAPLDDGRIVPVAGTVRRVERQEPARVRRPSVNAERAGRDWKKSAVIIGSSAGIGAGVGAAIGGKKGALIGAAVGGGGATIWDQVTRRK